MADCVNVVLKRSSVNDEQEGSHDKAFAKRSYSASHEKVVQVAVCLRLLILNVFD